MVAALLWMLVSIWNAPPASLGEAALREAVRRQRVAPATRVINDTTLGPAPVQPAPAVLPAPAAPPVQQAQAEVAVKADPEAAGAKPEVKDQAWWRARMTTARESLTRDRLLVTALESRVAALAADIAARDDPEQRAQLMLARQHALAELERMKKQVETDQLAITTIEDEARKAGVPPGWIR